jgi:dephospho-CoA kinase
MAMIIGLTGGIGSGKSTIAKVFANLGVPVFDADAAAKNIMQANPLIREKLIRHFGPEVYIQSEKIEGTDLEEHAAPILNRAYLSKIVFSDNYQLEVLNAIVHPITIQTALDWAATQDAPYVIKEAALFFESGSVAGMHKMIGVTAPLSLRIHRVMKRDGVTKEEVQKRMSHQIEESIKMKLCDWVIVNDDQHLVLPQVLALHGKILAELK